MAREIDDLLALFAWREALGSRPNLRVADIGARNFFLAEVLDARFRALGAETEIHGIELDAFRRYRNLRMRCEYGEHYARQIRHGEFHAADFLEWRASLDVALLLNPFVHAQPLRAWGLPLRHLRPGDQFRHVRQLLDDKRGVLLVTCPTRAELALAKAHAYRAGFALRERHDWRPPEGSRQRQPRFAALFVIA